MITPTKIMINTYSKIPCPLSYGENLFILFTLCPVINYGAFFLLYSFLIRVVNPSVCFRSFPIDEKNRLSMGYLDARMPKIRKHEAPDLRNI